MFYLDEYQMDAYFSNIHLWSVNYDDSRVTYIFNMSFDLIFGIIQNSKK